MPEEKQSGVVNDEYIPESRLGLLLYIGSRLKRNANQLTSNVSNLFKPVFTQDSDDEALLENDALSQENEPCKEPSLLAEPSDNIFDAEYEEALKNAKINVEKFKELLNEELPLLETINTSIPPDNLSAKIGTLLEPLGNLSMRMSDKIRSLVKEGNNSAQKKARLLAEITKQVSTLRAPNEYYREEALIQAIATVRKSIIDNQGELSRYRSKWGSGFFFGTLLKMDLTGRVSSKTLVDDLTTELDDIEKRINAPERIISRIRQIK